MIGPGPLRTRKTSSRLTRVALAGNPNTGKTTLFNRLTKSRAKVGNYPGVTVERHSGRLSLPLSGEIELVDVPGTYSLAARSEEEQVAIRALAGLSWSEAPDAVLIVVDASQLTRNLYLVLQIAGLHLPALVALNMTDVVRKSGEHVDAQALERELGMPVVAVSGSTGEGLDALRDALDRLLIAPERGRPGCLWRAGPELAAALAAVGGALPEAWTEEDDDRRTALAAWALLSLGEGDELADVPPALRRAAEEEHRRAEAAGRELDAEIVRAHYEWIDARAELFQRSAAAPAVSLTDRIDRVLLHPALGFALFLVLMVMVFQSLFAWADPLIGLIESAVGWVQGVVQGAMGAGVVRDLLSEGVIAGVGAVLVFLPQILLLFFFIGLMEDTGYMARVAFLMDRIMKAIGLHGRAFVPMLSGYACAVPAILATRTMERKRDRLLTMMVIPLMTCSARLPVYGLLIAALYPPNAEKPFAQGMLMVAMYLFSTVVALLAAAVLGRTLLKGPKMPLLMEMPPYRMPHWPSVVRMMWQRSAVFLREAGTVILVCTVAMWFLLSFPRDAGVEARYDALRADAAAELAPAKLDERLAELDAEEKGELLRQSWGGRLGKAIEPTLEPLGFDWKLGIGLIGAFAAREVFVSTMAVVYGLDAESDETSPALRDRVRAQRRADGSKLFTPLVCFALMVFFALACQCMSTLAAVRRETASWRWPAFLFVYMTALAWVASFVVFQGGRLIGFA